MHDDSSSLTRIVSVIDFPLGGQQLVALSLSNSEMSLRLAKVLARSSSAQDTMDLLLVWDDPILRCDDRHAFAHELRHVAVDELTLVFSCFCAGDFAELFFSPLGSCWGRVQQSTTGMQGSLK